MNQKPKGGYHPPKPSGWGIIWGTLLALILAVAVLFALPHYIYNRIQYLDADLQRELIIPD